jgi:hypothetical protein
VGERGRGTGAGGRDRLSIAAPAAVLFDFGGTLDADGVPWSARFFGAYRERGGTLAAAAFDEVFRESDRRLAELPHVGRLGFRATLDAQGRVL